MANIITNDLTGLERGFETEIGPNTYKVKALPVIKAREGWVKVQPMLRGFMISDELAAAHELEIGSLAMAALVGGLTDDVLKWLADEFSQRTTVSSTNIDAAQPLQDVPLHMKGIMDAVFAGDFESFMTWLDVCITFNFGAQIAKTVGAAKKLIDKAKAAAPKAEPKTPEFV